MHDYTAVAVPQHVAVYHDLHQFRKFRRAVHLRLLEMVKLNKPTSVPHVRSEVPAYKSEILLPVQRSSISFCPAVTPTLFSPMKHKTKGSPHNSSSVQLGLQHEAIFRYVGNDLDNKGWQFVSE